MSSCYFGGLGKQQEDDRLHAHILTGWFIPQGTMTIRQPHHQPIRILQRWDKGSKSNSSICKVMEAVSQERDQIWSHTSDTRRLIGCKVGSSGIKPAATIGMMAVKILLHRHTGTNRRRYTERGERDEKGGDRDHINLWPLFDPNVTYSSHLNSHQKKFNLWHGLRTKMEACGGKHSFAAR